MLKGFKDFVTAGNLIEVAVGLIMALALFGLVQALIADLITPIIAAVVGEPDFGGLSFTINGSEFFYGDFINALITFVSVAAAVYFFVVVPYQRYKQARGIGTGTQALPRVHDGHPGRRKAMPPLHGAAGRRRRGLVGVGAIGNTVACAGSIRTVTVSPRGGGVASSRA